MQLNAEELLIISKIALRIKALLGLHFTENRFGDLARGVTEAAKELNRSETLPLVLDWLNQSGLSESELKVLSTHLTVNETYFFRERMALDLLVEKIVPELLSGKKQITIWCAGCSSGEEPYSIAMTLFDNFSESECGRIKLLATDISERVLNKARSAIYSAWSFRETPDSTRAKYFVPMAKLWELIPKVRKFVTFEYLNLVADPYTLDHIPVQNVDVIFCRNVLIYFEKPTINAITRKFYNCLSSEGWLIPSQTELNEAYFPDFKKFYFGSNIFYHKTNLQKQAAVNAHRIENGPTHLPMPKVIKRRAEPPVQPKKTEKTEKDDAPSLTVSEVVGMYRSGQYEQIVRMINGWVNNDPADMAVYTICLQCYIQLGVVSDTVIWADQVLKRQNVNARFLYVYGTYLLEQGELEMASKVLKKAVYLDGTHVLSYISLGHLAVEQNNSSRALKYFGNAINLIDSGINIDFVDDAEGMTRGDLRNMIMHFIELLV